MRRVYQALAVVIVLLYAVASWSGWGFLPHRRGFLPAGIRQAPGGYRSYSFWRGGK